MRRRWTIAILLAILLVSAALRLVALGRSPPGMHTDEGSNIWNAYCLLKTGQDQHGAGWPIFYTRAFGENRSTLFLYMLLPFQAVGGPSVSAARAASAFYAVLTVALTYFVAGRLFGRPVGLVTAGLLAVNPWHLQQSRWAHEATLTPLLIVLPLAAALWAGLPLAGNERGRLRVWRALVAGLVGGICCYGYPVVRLFLPALFVGAILVRWRAWWNRLKTREGAAALVALLVGLGLSFGPLAWKHLTDPNIGKRGATAGWVWQEADPPATRAAKVLARYPGHFGPEFLFLHGDTDIALSPPGGTGLFHWYMAPLMVLGVIVLVGRLRSSPPVRLLLVWVALYPCGDLLSRHPSLHALRSLPGLCALVTLAAVGAAGAGTWLWQHRRRAALPIGAVLTVAILGLNARFLNRFYGEFNRQPEKRYVGQTDLLAACQWLRPRLGECEAVFVTTSGMSHPYIYALVGLRWEPRQWFAEPRRVVPGPLPGGLYIGEDVCTRFGKVHFMFDDTWRATRDELKRNGRPDRAFLVLRAGEAAPGSVPAPAWQTPTADDRLRLLIYELEI